MKFELTRLLTWPWQHIFWLFPYVCCFWFVHPNHPPYTLYDYCNECMHILYCLVRGVFSYNTVAMILYYCTYWQYSKCDDSPTTTNIMKNNDSTTGSNNDSNSNINNSKRRPVLCALVACAGDSRCITDDGGTRNSTGAGLPTEFRAVTKDHRPGEPEEHRRLQKCVKRGVCLMQHDNNNTGFAGALRIYPWVL
jgi:hypothetical protein